MERPPRTVQRLSYALGALVASAAWAVGVYAWHHVPAARRMAASDADEAVPVDARAYFTGTPVVLRFPDAVREDIVRVGGNIDNADTPDFPRAPDHESMLTTRDERVDFRLRPSVGVRLHVLPGERALNLEPPMLYFPEGTPYPPALRAYLDARARQSFVYHTNALGQRRTLPEVNAPKEVLFVGDSVTFGVGVDDEHTVVSHLQQRLGSRARAVNGGVGEYAPHEILASASRYLEERTVAALIYIVCENDFIEGLGSWSEDDLAEALDRLAALRQRVTGPIIVVGHARLDFVAGEVFYARGQAQLPHVARLLKRLEEETVARGLRYLSWLDIAAAERARTKTLLSDFALYVDLTHWSPRGNQLMAEAIYRRLEE